MIGRSGGAGDEKMRSFYEGIRKTDSFLYRSTTPPNNKNKQGHPPA